MFPSLREPRRGKEPRDNPFPKLPNLVDPCPRLCCGHWGCCTLSDSVVMLMDGFFWVLAVLAPQRRLRPPGWPPSVSLFPDAAPLAAAATQQPIRLRDGELRPLLLSGCTHPSQPMGHRAQATPTTNSQSVPRTGSPYPTPTANQSIGQKPPCPGEPIKNGNENLVPCH